MQQLALDLAQPRRIDLTLERLDIIVEGLTDEQRARIAGEQWWSLLVVASRLRGMEMAEGRSPLADDYDRLVTPGEHPVEAIVRTLQHHLRAAP